MGSYQAFGLKEAQLDRSRAAAGFLRRPGFSVSTKGLHVRVVVAPSDTPAE